MSDGAISAMLETTADPENLKKLAAVAGYWKTLNGNFANLKALGIPLHPSAAKYWESRGFDIAGVPVAAF